MATASVHSQYLDGQAHMDCSDKTAAQVDEAVKDLLNRCYGQARQALEENRALLDEIAAYLLVKETITGEELMDFVNKAAAPAQNPEESREENGEA